MNVRWVKQEDRLGCGGACMAMLTGKTYDEVKAAFPDVGETTGIRGNRDIDHYLAKNGYAVARRYRQDNGPEWRPEPFGSVHLVELKVSETSPCSHFVVLLADGSVLDPLTPDTRRLSDYHEVYNIAAVVPVR